MAGMTAPGGTAPDGSAPHGGAPGGAPPTAPPPVVLSVVGARPQLVKLAPVAAALERAGLRHVVVHTGQHYDPDLSEVFFSGLRIPEPLVRLGVGSGSHGEQTGRMLAALDPVLAEHRPDWVLVYGDTNSTLAGALAAAKQQLPVAHLEAGLRSFNRRMPEEHNRVLTDHAADLLLAPTEEAMARLRTEGLGARAVLVGDVMADVCLRVREEVRRGAVPPPPLPAPPPTSGGGVPEAGPGTRLGAADGSPRYLVATVHRAENTDDPARLEALLDALARLPVPVLLPAHPRLLDRVRRAGGRLERGAIRVCRPLPYAQMVAAVLGSAGVVTDSGGLQKEARWLGRPCTTLRAETEWPETLRDGWNVLVPAPWRLGAAEWEGTVLRPAPALPRGDGDGVADGLTDGLADGRAADRVAAALVAHAPEPA
ncbi:non-hydrolyzing UDP-N-acetylglucosamine 2-epimerase [Allostreptomyces psammosilenae]|uniref:UDP-N-acetylglucosamine 2-epimerase (Non-hydrolyzing) n=1 Tax=Allostreptomyces psammosilenae TaxID=1892865 RepID=A0A853ADT4_9ACTN|nr:UDP-N-acetylglucosamine 2-epimerase (non-hydrolyzing) [Allostreptomyces psammosilenae]NYI08482.1 UDP-N-acetylglucosamine 2-epimerase (non-hydrolyzing) [Allostreptomyces psammosilenae]